MKQTTRFSKVVGQLDTEVNSGLLRIVNQVGQVRNITHNERELVINLLDPRVFKNDFFLDV